MINNHDGGPPSLERYAEGSDRGWCDSCTERQRLHELPESERLTVYVAAVSSHQFQGTTMEDLFTSLEKHRL